MNAQEADKKATILIVEDDVEMARMISSLLEQKGYSVVVTRSGEGAWDILGLHEAARPEHPARPDLIVLDVLMEGPDGYQVCQRLKQNEQLGYIPVIMLTVLDSLSDKVKGLEYGADDYVTKPFKGEELVARIESLLRVKRLYDELKRAEEELRQSCTELQQTLNGTIHAWVSAIEVRDAYTANHQRGVAQLACAIAREMRLPEDQIEGIRVAALIHDIGKINVPLEVLSKPTELTELERSMIRAHPQVGYDVLKTARFPWPVAEIVLQHHERLDGSGYPQGLSGEKIILEARILAVADVVKAMSSHRPSGGPWGMDKALEEISQNRGILYDSQAVDACLKLFSEKGFTFSES